MKNFKIEDQTYRRHTFMITEVNNNAQRGLLFHHQIIFGSWLSPFSANQVFEPTKILNEKEEEESKKYSQLVFYDSFSPKFQGACTMRCKIADIKHHHLVPKRVFLHLAKPYYYCFGRKQEASLDYMSYGITFAIVTMFLSSKTFFAKKKLNSHTHILIYYNKINSVTNYWKYKKIQIPTTKKVKFIQSQRQVLPFKIIIKKIKNEEMTKIIKTIFSHFRLFQKNVLKLIKNLQRIKRLKWEFIVKKSKSF